MKAAGAYLRRLREEKFSNRDKIAAVLKVNRTQIESIEGGIHDVGSGFMFDFIRVVDADPRHVADLMAGKDDADGMAAADAFADDQLKALEKSAADPHRDERFVEVDAIIERLINHPRSFDKWLGYGEMLLRDQIDNGQ